MSFPDSLNTKKITTDFKAVLEENPHHLNIPDHIADEVFEVASKEKPIFNGTLVCVKNFSPSLITGYTISFKEYLASYHVGYRGVHKPMAVSGWVRHNNKILFGIRSEKVLFSSKLLELVPSGAVDDGAIEGNKIDFKTALINEFEQETGLFIDVVESIRPEIIVYCKEKYLYDICQSITLKSDVDIYCDDFNDEYSDLFWVPISEIPAFIEDNKHKVHPTTLAIIESKILF